MAETTNFWGVGYGFAGVVVLGVGFRVIFGLRWKRRDFAEAQNGYQSTGQLCYHLLELDGCSGNIGLTLLVK